MMLEQKITVGKRDIAATGSTVLDNDSLVTISLDPNDKMDSRLTLGFDFQNDDTGQPRMQFQGQGE